MDGVLDHLEAEFEKAKPSWYGLTDRLQSEYLPLPGRPHNLNRPDRGLVGSAFRLSRYVGQVGYNSFSQFTEMKS
jgi:hypothetical protein